MLIGHSFGGAAVLSTIQDMCVFPFCSRGFSFPTELLAGAVYGTDLRDPLSRRPIAPIDNSDIPVIVLRGSLDGLAAPADVEDTFHQIQDPPKALVTVLGANHYAITDANNPPGAIPDGNRPALEQAVATETIARWSALFLRAYALGDPDALDYVTSAGPLMDDNVTVRAVHVE